jgi:hypothetical protein
MFFINFVFQIQYLLLNSKLHNNITKIAIIKNNSGKNIIRSLEKEYNITCLYKRLEESF